LKSEETIKLKAEMAEKHKIETEKRNMLLSIASSDVMRQSLLTFKEQYLQSEKQAELSSGKLHRHREVVNTESAPKGLLESHAKLFSKYVNSANQSLPKPAEICTVQVTLKADEEEPHSSKFNQSSEYSY